MHFQCENRTRKCLFPPWEKDVTDDFFFLLRQKCFRGRLYPPEGRLYAQKMLNTVFCMQSFIKIGAIVPERTDIQTS